MSAPLYRFIALTHTYRRLFTVFLSLPALVLIFPVACGLVCALFGLCPVSQASIWISAAVRLASGMAMLEVLVMARFVGPTSISKLLGVHTRAAHENRVPCTYFVLTHRYRTQ